MKYLRAFWLLVRLPRYALRAIEERANDLYEAEMMVVENKRYIEGRVWKDCQIEQARDLRLGIYTHAA